VISPLLLVLELDDLWAFLQPVKLIKTISNSINKRFIY
jgi:hypothetical protein